MIGGGFGRRFCGRANRAGLMAASAGLALTAAMAMAVPACAQDADAAAADSDVTEVVVTGIRRGIQNAINVKRRSDSIVEAVSSEDIGKLPDQSIAESIARLPGVAAQRSNGRAQALSVRGLGPDYTVTTLNGREQVSTNDNRSVEFDQYPSDLISGVTVYKTPQANMVAQGLAGTADLQTVRPLTFNKRQVALGARYEKNSTDALVGGSTNSGKRYTAIYIDQFADNTVGVALGYSYMSSPTQATRWEAWGYPEIGANNGGAVTPGTETAALIGGAKPNVMSSELVREGVMGVLEYRPNDRFHTILDAYVSDFDETQYFSGVEFPLAWGGLAVTDYTVDHGMVTSGTFDGVKAIVNNHLQQRHSKVSAFGWNMEYRLTDNWTLAGDLSYSRVERDDLILETNSGTGPNGSGPYDKLGFTQNDQTGIIFSPTLDYADFDLIRLTSPQGWGGDNVAGGQVGYYNNPGVVDDLTAFKLLARRDFDSSDLFSHIEVGFNRTERTKEKVVDEAFLGLKGGLLEVSVPEEFRKGTTNLSFIGTEMISYDPLGLLNSGFYERIANVNGDVVIKDWKVEETVDTWYVRFGLDTSFFGTPLTGNVGVQVQQADQRSTANSVDNAGATYLSLSNSGGTTYTDVLPSVNLIFHIQDDLKLRLAAATTLARPRMGDMSAARTYNYNPTAPSFNGYHWESSGGNPLLKPWKADALDMSVEKYFGGKGYVSFSLFYKDLKSYIYDKAVLSDFSGFPTGMTGAPAGTMGFNYSKANGSGGWIKGSEFAVSVPGEILWAPLDGFGALFSVATNNSKIQPEGFAEATALPGLSKRVINTTLYYEKYGFSARVSQRKRSDFLGEVPGFGAGLEQIMVKAESIIDAQLGYTFQNGPLEGLSFLLQGNNLTNEPFSTYQNGDKAQVKYYQEYGRTLMFGVNYRF